MKHTSFTAPLLVQPRSHHDADMGFSAYRQSTANSEAGVTLIELLAVIVIAGILMAIALPNLTNFIANGRITSAANDIASGLMLTRSVASSSRGQAVVCPSSDTATTSCTVAVPCSTTPNDWIFSGRIVFLDKNSNGSCDNGETIIRHIAPSLTPDSSGAVTSIVPTLPNANNWIAFNPYGQMIIPGGTISSASFKLCVKNASMCRQIAIDFSGRTSIIKVP